jgi:redox-sensitive bicupin YhaK (pirin superfamily)
VRTLTARTAEVGGLTIRRALPQRTLRTVGPWCFADHMGPELITPTQGLDVGPHPHIGLHTATWLFEGAIVHTDSLGSDQLIRPGELNLMTAGHGIVHAEQADRVRSQTLHGIQLWLAQPHETREGNAGFTHHAQLPRVESGAGQATVFIGDFAGTSSAAVVEHPAVGVDVTHRAGSSTWALDPDSEYAVYCAVGSATVNGAVVTEGELLAWEPGTSELAIESDTDARLVVLGGAPWGEPLFMWWNFVARSQDEIREAISAWSSWSPAEGTERFARLPSTLAPMPAPPLP